MRKYWKLTFAMAAVLLPANVFGAAVIEIRAVKVNDVAITPTTTPSVSPGDKVEAEIILLPGFADVLPTGIRAAQVNLAGRVGVTSGGNDRVLPLGWDAPIDLIPCSVTADCPFGFSCSGGKCVGGAHFPSLGAFITTARPDYLLFGEDFQQFIGTTTLDYVYGSLNRDANGVTDDGSTEYYLGTLIVEIGDFACGTFTFSGITMGIGGVSELTAPDNITTVTPSFNALEINTGTCGPIPSDPLLCSLDARYPHPPTSPTPSFIGDSIVLEFDVNPGALRAADFAVSTVPPTFPLPTITSVQVNRQTATVTLASEFALGKWTCVRHLDTNRVFCRAVLSGDSDQNQVVEIADIDALLLDLDPPALVDGEPYVPLPLPACDIDRSGACSPLDLLGSVNLLGGSGAFSPGFLGDMLDFSCPGAPQP